MCPPKYYGIEYEINPWMSRRRRSDQGEARRQWEGLRKKLRQLGAEVSCLAPVQGLPDLVFTANAALIYERIAVLSRFRRFQRQGEERHYEAWLAAHGFEIRRLPPGMSFEGAGDALICGESLFAGYRVRSDILAHQKIAETIGCRVIPLELIDPRFYHLDTCFCPLDMASTVYYPPAFDAYGRKALRESVEDLIPVIPEEACEFACNAVVLGRSVVTNTGCPELHCELAERGFTPYATPLGEFLKAGGSAKCLTLRLDGEDAAAWKHESEAGAFVRRRRSTP
jgi:N-dimethylarginine dimethylaminohydrolase